MGGGLVTAVVFRDPRWDRAGRTAGDRAADAGQRARPCPGRHPHGEHTSAGRAARLRQRERSALARCGPEARRSGRGRREPWRLARGERRTRKSPRIRAPPRLRGLPGPRRGPAAAEDAARRAAGADRLSEGGRRRRRHDAPVRLVLPGPRAVAGAGARARELFAGGRAARGRRARAHYGRPRRDFRGKLAARHRMGRPHERIVVAAGTGERRRTGEISARAAVRRLRPVAPGKQPRRVLPDL